MSDKSENQFLKRVRANLDQASAGLDDATLAQLRAARARALAAEIPVTRARRRTRFYWPLLGTAVSAGVAALAVAVWLTWVPTPAPMARSFDDIEILTSNESPEFYADFEFYRWLASQRDAG